MTSSMLSRAAAALACACLPTLLAQTPCPVPDGWYAVAGSKIANIGFPGDGGVFLLHPRNPMPMIPVQGLPPALTGATTTPTWWEGIGASAILFDPRNDEWIVGNVAPSGNAVNLDFFQVSGTPATGFTAINLRTTSLGTSVRGGPTQPTLRPGQVSQMAMLPNGDLLVACPFVRSNVLQGTGAELALVSRTTGSVTRVPVQGVNSPWLLYGLCIDPSGTTAYLGFFDESGQWRLSEIYEIPIPSGGTPQLRASIPNADITQLVYDPTIAMLYASFWVPPGSNAANPARIDPVTGTVVPVLRGWEIFNAMCQDPVTGCLVLGGTPAIGSSQGGIHWVDSVPSLQFLSNNTRAGPRGGVTGIAVVPNPRSYGAPSGAAGFHWSQAPSWSGLPTVGNAAFSVTVAQASVPPPTPPSWWTASLASAALPNWRNLGIDLLVNPNPRSFVTFSALPTSGTLSLPIPPVPSLAEFRIHLQTFHMISGALAASNGLRITVL